MLKDNPNMLIRNPFVLLSWLWLQPMVVRRAVSSVHPKLDERINIWDVDPVAQSDPRVRALNRARLWLLMIVPLLSVGAIGGLAIISDISFPWRPAVLLSAAYSFGAILSELWHTQLARPAFRWSAHLIIVVALGLWTLRLSSPNTALQFIPDDLYHLVLGLSLAFSLVGCGLGARIAAGAVLGGAAGLVLSNSAEVIAGRGIPILLFTIVIGLALILSHPIIGASRWWGFFTVSISVGIAWSLAFGILGGAAVLLMTFVGIGMTIGVADIQRVRGFGRLRDLKIVSGCVAILIGLFVLALGIQWVIGFIAGFFGETPAVDRWGSIMLASWIIVLLIYLRLPAYLTWHLPRSLILSIRLLRHPEQACTLWKQQLQFRQWTVVLPLVGLTRHLVTIAEQSRTAFIAALEDITDSGYQLWATTRAVEILLDAQLRDRKTAEQIAQFHKDTEWLRAALSSAIEVEAVIEQKRRLKLLMELRDVSADTERALDALTREARERLLNEQIQRLLKLQQAQATKGEVFVANPVLDRWLRALEEERDRLSVLGSAQHKLPYSYSYGAALKLDDSAFQGRDELFSALKNLLVSRPYRAPFLLLGQTRMGKTSILKQLPHRLGEQVVSIFLDMQAYLLGANAAAVLGDIAEAIIDTLQMYSDIPEPPPIDEKALMKDPYRTFSRWITTIEATLGDERWLLLVFDEFNEIDQAVNERRLDTRIFSLFQTLIQEHQRVTLVFCGTLTLAESHQGWFKVLKGVQTIPVTYLRRDEAERVFTAPRPDFPKDVYSEEAINRVLTLTGCNPALLHLIGEKVVERYNNQLDHPSAHGTPERQILPEMIDDIVPAVLAGAEGYFGSLWQWLLTISGETNTACASALLHVLADTSRRDGAERPEQAELLEHVGERDQRSKLLDLYVKRDLLIRDEAGDYHFHVPLVAQWIQQQR